MTDYIVAKSWSHIFLEEEDGLMVEKERECRFVLDRYRLRFVRAEVLGQDGVRAATDHESDDLLDSVLNSQPGLIDAPSSYGLIETDSLTD